MTPKTIFSLFAVMILLLSCSSGKKLETANRGVTSANKVQPQSQIQITPLNAQKIGHKIWMNEGAGKLENLIVWNKGEKFVSLGIGHFIWYPANFKPEKRFDAQFPELIKFLQQKSVRIPKWMQKPNCPWVSEATFNQDKSSNKMHKLRELLENTIPKQVEFIIRRLENALPKMLATLKTEEDRKQVREQFDRVAKTQKGIYALVDYVNFKGEGINKNERYNGEGWGLLQVLENMFGNDDENVMEEFIQAADGVLTRRVQNASAEGKDEEKWLAGWRYRLKTYNYEL